MMTESDSNSESDSNPRYTEAYLDKAILSNPFYTISVLGAYLGVDCDAVHDRGNGSRNKEWLNEPRAMTIVVHGSQSTVLNRKALCPATNY